MVFIIDNRLIINTANKNIGYYFDSNIEKQEILKDSHYALLFLAEIEKTRKDILEKGKEGTCPLCNADVEYISLEQWDDGGYRKIACTKCEFKGKEWFDHSFSHISNDSHTFSQLLNNENLKS
jgi:hypothetical protein